MLKTFTTLLVAAVLGTGFATTSAQAVVGQCDFGGQSSSGANVFPNGDLSSTIVCSGIYNGGIVVVPGTVASINGGGIPSVEQVINEFSVNMLAFRGITDWQLVEEISGTAAAQISSSNDNGMNLTLTNTNGNALNSFYGKSGQWSVSSFGADAVRAAIVILNERDDWAIYLLSDLSLASGTWSFAKGNYIQDFAKARQLKSFQIYISTEVPVPAALPMLLTGIAGIALLARRKRKAA
ncbi:MAG: hypothetical protein ACJAVR_002920 [Paracoccaceae bacterium]|jgi:hypothetical protein